MNCDFFADESDKIELLNFIFNETSLRIFDHYSEPGKNITEYKSANDIVSVFDLKKGGSIAVAFQLWSPVFKGEPVFRKVELDPRYCEGNTFRYATEGWGLIQLYFGGLKDNQLHHSHIGHFNQKGALKYADINVSNGKVNQWDWKEITHMGNRLRYLLHTKLAVKKVGSYAVLKGAQYLESQGVILV